MAREGRSSGKTSFGKRTQAEKNFRDRKKEKPDREKPRGKSFGKKPGSSFRKRDEGGSGERSFSKPSFKKSDDRFSRFKKEDSPKRSRFDNESGERRSGSFRKSSDESGEKRFSKRPTTSRFSRDENKSGERSFSKPGFRKSGSDRFKGEGSEKPKRSGFGRDENKSSDRSFSKPSFRKSGSDRFKGEGSERPKRSGFNRDENRSGERSFSKPGFKRRDNDETSFEKKRFEGEEKPRFERRERTQDFGKPYKSRVKKKSFGGPKQEHQRKNIDAGVKQDDGLIRLNKFMANSGVGSRREADELIKMGLVTVNGETITEMGHKVKPTDDIRYEGRKLKAEPLVYVLLNKPKGFITTTDDPEERNTVMDIVGNACKERIYPVGRLDRNTTGLLLFTNDGDLADKLTHPSYNVKKIYKAELDRPLTKADFQKILDGVYFEEGRAVVDDLAMVSDDAREVGIEIHIGWNRIVRRIFEALGYDVVRLDRVVYAGLDKKDLGRGEWRFLKPEEIVRLKHFKA
jgi:23S rRNA pseudouridine2605 synthase